MNSAIETIKAFIIQHSQNWTADIVAILIFSTIVWALWRTIYAHLATLADKTAMAWDDVFLLSLKTPISVLIWCWPVTSGMGIILEDVFERSLPVINSVKLVLLIVIIVWMLFRLISNIEKNLVKQSKRDATTIHALSKLVRLFITVMAVMAILQSLGLSLSGLLTFGGVGGLIVGLAAKDLLSNFFGGMMVYLDRPFKVGDWIRSPDRAIEGTVEKIGWRMTSIRTFDKRPLYVPNSVFSNIVVENPSRMHNRRIHETIGIRYQDGDKMDVIIKDVTAMIKQHPDIDTRQTIIVNFSTFGPSSLDFFIYTFTKTVEWVRFHQVKQDVLLKVLAIIHQHGADVAFPTRTLHMQSIEPEPEQ